MKIISKGDLQLLIAAFDGSDSFDEEDFEAILERFGDDYFIGDSGKLEKTENNKEMQELREKAHWRTVCTKNGYHKECPVCRARWMLDSKKHICVETPLCYNCGAKLRKEDTKDESTST